ncbi:PUA domain-containing protein [Methanohalophilus mahii]|uniref:PUA domain containing protein n=1 Tax=Methanohalophilus mahii (strain ATCC 35705 / DSM 5219 / SLP) TaxID=547558 RepID=D5E9W8_METMS|nr:PUA domain containing protein [Methanohalophilus mahii DSM 5219]
MAMTKEESRIKQVRTMADYQFGKGCGNILFSGDITFKLSRTKRIRQIFSEEKRMATVRARDGMFTLSIEGASRIHSHLPAPGYRVMMCDDAIPFVSKGKTAFAKHVENIDSDLRAGDEVLLVDKHDNLIATGQLLLAPEEVLAMQNGPAVDVRVGVNSS